MQFENIDQLSDKVYWHQFDVFYDSKIDIVPEKVMEIGIAQGNSIRLLREKYPKAVIHGFDIIEQQESWPVDSGIFYHRIDQGNEAAFAKLMQQIDVRFDLIIEDGSHDPLHQKVSLMQCLDYLSENAIYILEDLHTSHSAHRLYKQRGMTNFPVKKPWFSSSKKSAGFYPYFGPLHCLLMLDFHIDKKLKSARLESVDFDKSLFSFDEIQLLLNRVKHIDFFKRLRLPYYCYHCKTDNFNFSTLTCNCGAALYEDCDSMTAVLKF